MEWQHRSKQGLIELVSTWRRIGQCTLKLLLIEEKNYRRLDILFDHLQLGLFLIVSNNSRESRKNIGRAIQHMKNEQLLMTID